jgi:hypothetical protein
MVDLENIAAPLYIHIKKCILLRREIELPTLVPREIGCPYGSWISQR